MAKINLTPEQIAERNKKIADAMRKKWRSRKRQASLKKSARAKKAAPKKVMTGPKKAGTRRVITLTIPVEITVN